MCLQAQHDNLQEQNKILKQQLNDLKNEKQSNFDKAEENKKIAQNQIAGLQRQNDDLVNEIGALRV